jgi:hypothetical protein
MKVLEKIEKVEERLNNIESSNFLIEKKAREDEKKQRLREAFELKQQNQKHLEEINQ